jgi:hypothetical protein
LVVVECKEVNESESHDAAFQESGERKHAHTGSADLRRLLRIHRYGFLANVCVC